MTATRERDGMPMTASAGLLPAMRRKRRTTTRPGWLTRVMAALILTAAAVTVLRPGVASAASPAAGASARRVLAAAVQFTGAAGDQCYRQSRDSDSGTCVRLLPSKATGWSAPADGVPPAPSQCDFGAGHFTYSPDRFTSCTDVQWELYTYKHTVSGIKITGSMNFEDLQWNSYDAKSGVWTHGLDIHTGPGSGTLADGVSASVASECDSSKTCAVTTNLGPGDTQRVRIDPSSVFTDGWIEAETGPPAYEVGQFDVHKVLGVVISGPAATGIAPWSFTDAYLTGRCDSVVTPTPGCVNQDFIPTLTLSLGEYGAAAAMIKWAQRNLSGHWGLQGKGQPLHRLINKPLQGTNNTIICKTHFKKDKALNEALKQWGDEDSCDEFPFASSYESGAMKTGVDGKRKPYVTTGKDCAQVIAVRTAKSGKEAEAWKEVQPLAKPAGSEPCVRGHIPEHLNNIVGTAYSRAISSFRLIDKDAFWIAVTE
jgi:hypothetical protein